MFTIRCNNSTKRWTGCKNKARVRLVTRESKFGFPVHGSPLDLRLCHVHVRGWEDQLQRFARFPLSNPAIISVEYFPK